MGVWPGAWPQLCAAQMPQAMHGENKKTQQNSKNRYAKGKCIEERSEHSSQHNKDQAGVYH